MPGTDAYAGYLMAAAGFLALAHTLKKGEHIRVTLLLSALHGTARRALEIWALFAASALALLSAFYSVPAQSGSRGSFNDVSTSNDATPLWIPQLAMAIGNGGAGHRLHRRTGAGTARPPRAVAERRSHCTTNERPRHHRAARSRTLFLILGSGVWIGLTLSGVAWIGMQLFSSRPAGDAMAVTIWGSAASWTLTALPLFVWMGEILFRTRLSQDMFRGLAPWMQALPGRLLHVNVVGCAIFAAVSGSSAATCATIGKMSLPELKKRGYPDGISGRQPGRRGHAGAA